MKKKILLIITAILTIIITGIAIWYFKYIYKYNQIAKFTNNRNQEIYILGTYHNEHFKKPFNYSMQDITNCIKNIDPDIVLIESREDTYRDYNVVDGPIDMILAYSYCVQENIEVGMIDYWEINDNTKPGTTDKKRDDMINNNIMKKLETIPEGKKVLIICGDAHLHEQTKRFKKQGFNKERIQNKKELFRGDDSFKYPALMQETIENKINYASTTLKDDINNNLNNDKNKDEWKKSSDALVDNLKKQLELVKENKLYY